jgi:hypothetical protein
VNFENLPTLEQLRSATATDIQWRIADMCNNAIWPYLLPQNMPQRMPKWLGEGRVDFQFVARLCAQLSQQGLEPADLDNPNGQAAIQAITAAIMVSDDNRFVIMIHDEILIEMPSGEWPAVILAAQHLLHRQPRRYAVDHG